MRTWTGKFSAFVEEIVRAVDPALEVVAGVPEISSNGNLVEVYWVVQRPGDFSALVTMATEATSLAFGVRFCNEPMDTPGQYHGFSPLDCAIAAGKYEAFRLALTDRLEQALLTAP